MFVDRPVGIFTRVGIKTYDVLVRRRMDEARPVLARARSAQEVEEKLRKDGLIAKDERVISISERPERCQQ